MCYCFILIFSFTSQANITYVGQKGTYGQALLLSYQVTSATSLLTSLIANIYLNIYRVYDPPMFTGYTSYTIAENSEANILLSASSQTNAYLHIHNFAIFF